ncbi:ETS-related transcription factor Elf-3-like [Octopus sinensis]|uniref:ETS-related transcription factor Elf-3-like n=1 Tax=Octopus sinensis TaxID=2607531 RepID=A0A6P7SL80_9MOLL|nr:ETS-related transcription factor Elf-3-like [Octopus sinensis]
MAVVYEQLSPENAACINQCLDNIHSEDEALHFIYSRHLFDSYAFALINNVEQYEKWKITDPKFWSSDDVLDWLYYIGEKNDVDFGNFSAESFQCLKGEDLLLMPPEEFRRCEPTYGELIYSSFLRLTSWQMDELSYQVTEANTKVTDTNVYSIIREIMASENNFQSDDHQTCFGANLNQKELFNDSTENNPLPCSSSHDEPINVQFPLEVSLNQIQYDYLQPKTEYQIDEERDCCQNLSYTTLTNKMDCESKPDLSSPHTTKLKEEEEDNLHTSRSPKSIKRMRKNETKPSRKPTKCKATSSSSKSHSKARNTKMTRAGTHLWEFIRDLLHNEQYNPEYIRWEDRENGVFRFVASEFVAKLWGIKKHNTTMNYEKLSRAMRFSRSVGYFTKLPDSGIYPKKLCFKFGPKAFGWKK